MKFFSTFIFLMIFLLLTGVINVGAHPVVDECRKASLEYHQVLSDDLNTLTEKIKTDPDNPYLYFRLMLNDTQANTIQTEAYLNKADTLANDNIGIHWVFAQELLNAGSWRLADAEAELDQIYEIQLDRGIVSLPLIPHTLLNHAYERLQHASSSQDYYIIKKLFNYALKYDPTLLSPRFTLLWLDIKRLNFHDFSKQSVQLYYTFLDYIQNQYLLWLNIYHFIFALLYLTLMTLVFFFLIKYYPKMFHRLYETLPTGMPKFMKHVVGGLIVILPFILFIGLDPIWLALLAIMIIWIYLKPFELNMAILLIIFGLSTNLITSKIGGQLSVPFNPQSNFWMVNRAMYSGWDPALAENIEQRLAYEDDEEIRNDLKLSLAMLYKHKGDLKTAQTLYEDLANNDKKAIYFNNLGNIYFLQGLRNDALDMYEYANYLAEQEFVEYAEPYFNLGELYYKEFQLDQAMGEKEKAGNIDNRLMDRFRQIQKSDHHNRFLADMYPSQERLKEIIQDDFASGVKGHQANGFWSAGLITKFTTADLMGSGVAIAIILVLYVMIYRRQKDMGKPHLECSSCQAPISKKSRKMIRDEMFCPTCYETLKSVLKPGMQQHLRGKIQRKAEQSQRLRTRILSLFPGGGHILRDFLWRGLFFIIFVYIGVFIWINNGVFAPELPNLQYDTRQDMIKMVVIGLIWGIFYIFVMQNSVSAKHKVVKKEEPVEEAPSLLEEE